jgi:hypothetical protein
MRRGLRVTSPDGRRWEVRRRWADRCLPELRRRFRENRRETLDRDTLWSLWGLDFSGGTALSIASAAVLALLLLAFLPLIGIALELAIALVVAGVGFLSRLLLGRPWTVEAVDTDDPERRVAYAVKGWRRSARAVEELRRQIVVAGPPGAVG